MATGSAGLMPKDRPDRYHGPSKAEDRVFNALFAVGLVAFITVILVFVV